MSSRPLLAAMYEILSNSSSRELLNEARNANQLKDEMKRNNIPVTSGMSQRDMENALAAFYWKQRYPNKPVPEIFDPMLISKLSDKTPEQQEAIWKDPNWFIEVKRNGLRIIWHVKPKHKFTTRGRSTKDFLPSDVRKAFFWLNPTPGEWTGTVIDGEVISKTKNLDTRPVNGPSGEVTNNVLQAAMAAVSSSDPVKVQKANNMPLQYVMYDIIRYKGKDVTKEPYLQRRKYLSEFYNAFKNQFPDRLILNDTTNVNKKDFYEKVIAAGGEGGVLKQAQGKYTLGARTSAQLKVKRQVEVDAVVTGFVAPTKGSRLDKEGLVAGLKFSCKDIKTGKWFEVASVAGLTLEFRKQISIQNSDGSFKDITKETYGLVYELTGQEWGKNLFLTNARIARARVGADSKSADECVYDREAIKSAM